MEGAFAGARVRAHHAGRKRRIRSAGAGVSPDCVGGSCPSAERSTQRRARWDTGPSRVEA